MNDDELAARLGSLLGADEVQDLTRLSGGASRETFRFVAGGRSWVLQRQRPGATRDMAMEAALVRAAGQVGVPVPDVVAESGDPTVLGAPFMVLSAIEGETIARKILRDDDYASARSGLTAQLAGALAGIHRIDPADVPGVEGRDQLAEYRGLLDDLGEPHPSFELAFRWLETNRPPPNPTAVVHGDFRLGNIIVGPDGLRAVLDWELAHLGDPFEDLGWLCVRAWRFGGELPVAGLGRYEELFEAYTGSGGGVVDPEVVRWWEVLGTLKWGIMCIVQAASHLTGMSRSHELAAIGRRVCENEYDLFRALEGAW